MSDRKAKILTTARALFNKEGFSNVTIRMIAQGLGISSGNLTYHYQKREDIFEALYFEMVSEFDERLEGLDQTDVSMLQIRSDISSSMKRMMHYRFFWTDLYHLLEVNEAVKQHFQKVYKSRLEGSLLLYKKMTLKGLMYDPSFKMEYNILAERMVNYGNTWLYNSALYEKAIDTEDIERHANNLLAMLYPYLTDQGKLEFAAAIPGFFDES